MARKGRSAHPGRPFVIVLLLLCAIALFSTLRDKYTSGTIARRDVLSRAAHDEPPCRHVHQAKDQCAFVQQYCEDEDAGLLSYLQLYYCRLPNAKPLGFIIIALWTALLFTTIGVAASDFFCINLSTISGILGMSESMAGVTFLAFGNGSPDVFSTFAAMKTNSGSLAVGELIGAASFIAAVVAASMALVRPFKVAKKSFIRDVSFFIVAVGFSMFFLANGRLELWESMGMVGFYIFYVAVVVVWHWYLGQRRRRREKLAAARGHFTIPGEDEIETEEQYQDDPDDATETRSRPSRSRVVSTEDMHDLERANFETGRDSLDDLDEQAERSRWMGDLSANMRVTRPPGRTRSSTLNPIRPSLVGALEFQSVLASLQKSRNIRGAPISLRTYSDDLAYTAAQQKKAYSNSSDPEVQSNFEVDLDLPHTDGSDTHDGPWLSAPTNNGVRGRAVSANDAAGLQIDRRRLPLLNTDEHARPLLSPVISLSPTSSLRGSSPAAGRSRASTGADRLEIPGHEQHGHHRLPSAGPHFTESPPAMSPLLRPQLKISPPGSVQGDSRRLSMNSEFHDDVLEAPIATHPPMLRHASGDTVRDSLYPTISADDEVSKPLKWWPYHVLPPPHIITGTLFPTLTHFKKKGIFDKLLGICTAPCFFLLTITLPVVEPAVEEDNGPIISITPGGLEAHTPSSAHPHNSYHSGHLSLAAEAVSIEERHHHHDHTPGHTPIAETPSAMASDERATIPGDGLDPMDFATPKPKYWNRWLVLVHCFTAPWFILVVVWANFDDATWTDLGKASLWSLLGSAVFAGFVLLTTTATRPPKWQFVLCFAGFAVSIAWISTIANEVVGVLKAIGVVFNMSDAILGLTIFAVGNSLGDLVADVTVARLGYPVMALSACFGGPMLNILLGIGLSGSYMIITGEAKHHKKHPHQNPRFKPYHIEVSWTLLISAVGLLVTLLSLLVLVPLNKWRMDRRIGGLLVVIWIAATVTNVVVEMTGVADNWMARG